MSTGLAIGLGIFALWVLSWALIGAARRGDRQLRCNEDECARDELARIRRRHERESRRVVVTQDFWPRGELGCLQDLMEGRPRPFDQERSA